MIFCNTFCSKILSLRESSRNRRDDTCFSSKGFNCSFLIFSFIFKYKFKPSQIVRNLRLELIVNKCLEIVKSKVIQSGVWTKTTDRDNKEIKEDGLRNQRKLNRKTSKNSINLIMRLIWLKRHNYSINTEK